MLFCLFINFSIFAERHWLTIPFVQTFVFLITVYEAISFERKLQGGTTSPWIVIVEDRHQVVPFVVKLYTKPQHTYSPKLCEVICSALAPHFGLDVPPYGFVNFDPSFIHELNNEQKEQLKRKDSRINFATQFIEGSFKFEDALTRNYLTHYPIDTIFAFDTMVFNVDRWAGKPNILFKEHKSWLIDHEKTFPFNEDESVARIMNGQWQYDHRKHIFFEYLKNARANAKLNFFSEFFSYLSNIDFDVLDGYVDRMNELGLPTENFEVIKEYLQLVKRNRTSFVQNLRSVVT